MSVIRPAEQFSATLGPRVAAVLIGVPPSFLLWAVSPWYVLIMLAATVFLASVTRNDR
jgi:hypothetical protein